ncbi:MAG: hypothetical protein GW748_06610 [Alphaproteobacteria bacterium]|nr:hypothetical protein [Alphaproteobacteria bacterium]NCQ67398.1 hypothetical protein [Alphaproteobacteria bacterium]NCT06636.1 hypothetical protein [Alphaproteobacteria bacterium]
MLRQILGRKLIWKSPKKPQRNHHEQRTKLTWEHNPRAGRMQLVIEETHAKTQHVGSIGLGKNKKSQKL